MEVAIAIGVNFIVGAVLLALFAWRRPTAVSRIGGTQAALDLIRSAVPEASGLVVLSDDGESALLIGAHPGMTCYLQRHGHRYNARRLHVGEVGKIVTAGHTIRFRLRDFGWAECGLNIPDAHLRLTCLTRLSELGTNQTFTSATAGSHA